MRGVSAVTLICCLFISSVAFAQPFRPTEAELRHNAAALELAANSDYVAAIAEAEKAVAERGLNIFYLNLGRFQQRAQQCEAAIESYTQALRAPAVIEPSRKVVREAVQKYMTELVEHCPAQVKITCLPNDMRVVATPAAVEGDFRSSMEVACGSTVAMLGGSWTFVGTYGDSSTSEVRELRAARAFEVRLLLETPVVATPIASNSEAAAPEQRLPEPAVLSRPVKAPSSKMLPVLAMLTGTALLGTGLVLDVVPESSNNGELDGVDFVPLAMYIGGATLFALGVIAW